MTDSDKTFIVIGDMSVCITVDMTKINAAVKVAAKSICSLAGLARVITTLPSESICLGFNSNVDLNREPEWLRGGGDGFKPFERPSRRPREVVEFERRRRNKKIAAKLLKRTSKRTNRNRRRG